MIWKGEVGAWAKRLHSKYREMYWHILCDIAEYEYTLGKSAQQEEQHRCFSQAARLYQKYALEAASGTQVGQEKPTQLSEYALRQAMHLYHFTGNDLSGRRAHRDYIARVRYRFPGWKPEAQTVQGWQEITRAESSTYRES